MTPRRQTLAYLFYVLAICGMFFAFIHERAERIRLVEKCGVSP